MDADASAARLLRLEQELDAVLARQSARRLARIERDMEKLNTIMIAFAETTSTVEDQLLRFIASQREINTRQDAIIARLDVTMEAIKALLRERRHGDREEGR